MGFVQLLPETTVATFQQLERWRRERLSDAQAREVARLGEVVAKTRPVIAAILALADELKKETIDAVLRMSDLEVAVRYGNPRT